MAPPPVPGTGPHSGISTGGTGSEGEQAGAMEVEFEQAWGHAGELGEEDYTAMRE